MCFIINNRIGYNFEIIYFFIMEIFKGICFFIVAFLSSYGTSVRSIPDRLRFSFSVDSHPVKYLIRGLAF